MTKNIIFDFGTVLVDWDRHYLYDKVFTDKSLEEKFLNEICTYDWNCTTDTGRPFKEAIEEISAKFPEWEPQIRLYWERWPEMLGEATEGMEELMGELKAAGYRLWGLSNWSAETFPYALKKYDGIFSKLDGYVISGEARLVKPDPAIYRTLLERYSLDPSECIFIDDVQRNVDGGEACGIHSILFSSCRELRIELSRLGIL